ncbi:hypothetical protein SAMN05444484_105146 [Flavobacterium chilense]|uniref:Uncharacterized protein n=1 Tax=Flavobacterium chilense TaxID=946677 RepID=A0A1M7HVD1_9FLAO|nr:hypothetical protein SAMN05444484_105146 [Flavobacterium chilense]
MTLSSSRIFEQLAGDYPAESSGCYMCFYEIKM